MRIPPIAALLLLGCLEVFSQEPAFHKLDRARQAERIAADLKLASVYRLGLSNTLVFIGGQTNLLPAVKPSDVRLPRREEKEVLWQAWRSYLDYMLALDGLDSRHRDWWRLSGMRREASFAVSYAAFLSKYRFSLELTALARRNPLLDTILNEAVPEHGLPEGTYSKLKFRVLNVVTATDFGAQAALFQTMRDGAPDPMRAEMENDASVLLRMGHGQGPALTARNALKIVRSAADSAWFPVQAGVSEWMGDTKVLRRSRSLISAGQIVELHGKLLPGDVLLVRREWYLSNVGLPGFWPHAALYVGTVEERRKFFSDAAVADWIRRQDPAVGDFEQLLRARSTPAYADSLKPGDHGKIARVVEAISEGVSFTTLEHCVDADSAVVLRPRLAKAEKAEAILRAFHYVGRPYDFNFDFATDAELVCTELVFKAYEPRHGMHGLNLPLESMLGRQLLPANRIVRQFDEQRGTNGAQFDFVAFLDGHERAGRAVEASEEIFRKSWQRPKWHVLMRQDAK